MESKSNLLFCVVVAIGTIVGYVSGDYKGAIIGMAAGAFFFVLVLTAICEIYYLAVLFWYRNE